jgi:hypothetical protein
MWLGWVGWIMASWWMIGSRFPLSGILLLHTDCRNAAFDSPFWYVIIYIDFFGVIPPVNDLCLYKSSMRSPPTSARRSAVRDTRPVQHIHGRFFVLILAINPVTPSIDGGFQQSMMPKQKKMEIKRSSFLFSSYFQGILLYKDGPTHRTTWGCAYRCVCTGI